MLEILIKISVFRNILVSHLGFTFYQLPEKMTVGGRGKTETSKMPSDNE